MLGTARLCSPSTSSIPSRFPALPCPAPPGQALPRHVPPCQAMPRLKLLHFGGAASQPVDPVVPKALSHSGGLHDPLELVVVECLSVQLPLSLQGPPREHGTGPGDALLPDPHRRGVAMLRVVPQFRRVGWPVVL